jgi:peptide/nickel transport system substrate-binding protein
VEPQRLLTEAGYPNGFRLTLGAPSDGFENASQLAQAIASMWTRIGVRTELSAWTIDTFFQRRNKFEFSAYLSGAQVYTGEASLLLKAVLATPRCRSRYRRDQQGPLFQSNDGRVAGEATAYVGR